MPASRCQYHFGADMHTYSRTKHCVPFKLYNLYANSALFYLNNLCMTSSKAFSITYSRVTRFCCSCYCCHSGPPRRRPLLMLMFICIFLGHRKTDSVLIYICKLLVICVQGWFFYVCLIRQHVIPMSAKISAPIHAKHISHLCMMLGLVFIVQFAICLICLPTVCLRVCGFCVFI